MSKLARRVVPSASGHELLVLRRCFFLQPVLGVAGVAFVAGVAGVAPAWWVHGRRAAWR